MLKLYVLGGGAVLLTHPSQTAAAFRGPAGPGLRSPEHGGRGLWGHGADRCDPGLLLQRVGHRQRRLLRRRHHHRPGASGAHQRHRQPVDTGLICSVTGLSILAAGVLDSGLQGWLLTMAAYRTGLGPVGGGLWASVWCSLPSPPCPPWPSRGAGSGLPHPQPRAAASHYRLCFSLVAALGCLLSIEPALAAADLFNALLIAVNLILSGAKAPAAVPGLI